MKETIQAVFLVVALLVSITAQAEPTGNDFDDVAAHVIIVLTD